MLLTHFIQLEEVQGKEKWWSSTHTENDGGALNDPIMRNFYQSCLSLGNDHLSQENNEDRQKEKHMKMKMVSADTASLVLPFPSIPNSSPIPLAPSSSPPPYSSSSTSTSSSTAPSSSHSFALKDRTTDRCTFSNFTLSAINIGSQKGHCGVRVLRQFRSQSMSSVQVVCRIGKSAVERERYLADKQKREGTNGGIGIGLFPDKKRSQPVAEISYLDGNGRRKIMEEGEDQKMRAEINSNEISDVKVSVKKREREKEENGKERKGGQGGKGTYKMRVYDILEHLWRPSHDSWDDTGMSMSSTEHEANVQAEREVKIEVNKEAEKEVENADRIMDRKVSEEFRTRTSSHQNAGGAYSHMYGSSRRTIVDDNENNLSSDFGFLHGSGDDGEVDMKRGGIDVHERGRELSEGGSDSDGGVDGVCDSEGDEESTRIRGRGRVNGSGGEKDEENQGGGRHRCGDGSRSGSKRDRGSDRGSDRARGSMPRGVEGGIAVLCEMRTQNVKRLGITHRTYTSLIPAQYLHTFSSVHPRSDSNSNSNSASDTEEVEEGRGKRYAVHLLVDGIPVSLPTKKHERNKNQQNGDSGNAERGGGGDGEVEKDVEREAEKIVIHTDICIKSPVYSTLKNTDSTLLTQDPHPSSRPLFDKNPNSQEDTIGVIQIKKRTDTQSVSICDNGINHLTEKTFLNIGPVQRLYVRPFFIVYGTPPDPHLRSALKNLAVYVGNSHMEMYGMHVRVLTDLEYRAGGYLKRNGNEVLHSVMLIGGPHENKAAQLLFESKSKYNDVFKLYTAERGKRRVKGTAEDRRDEKGKMNSDDERKNNYHNNGNKNDKKSINSINRKKDEKQQRTFFYDSTVVLATSPVDFPTKEFKESRSKFLIGPHAFSDPNHGVIFTFPMVRRNVWKLRPSSSDNSAGVEDKHHLDSDEEDGEKGEDEEEEDNEEEDEEVAMCVCVHANSPEGYLHLSRFAWPYSSLHPSFSSLPDYTVVDEGVWGNGLGGALLAGYWGADWEYVLSDTYIW